MKRVETVNQLLTWMDEAEDLRQSKSIIYELNKAKLESFVGLNQREANRLRKDVLKIAPKYYEHTIKENGEVEYTMVGGNPVLKNDMTQAEFEEERGKFLDTLVNVFI